MADSLSVALLVLLESLSPEQRAVLLLRDVFDYGYDEIAEIVGKSEDNVRQLATRARQHVDAAAAAVREHPRAARRARAERFFAAAQEGDLSGLEALLAHDVTLHGDGGGKAPALARALHGRDRVARTLHTWLQAGARIPGAGMRPRRGQRRARGDVRRRPRARLIGVLALDIEGGQIRSISSIVNPDKLSHLGPVADLRALLRPQPGE